MENKIKGNIMERGETKIKNGGSLPWRRTRRKSKQCFRNFNMAVYQVYSQSVNFKYKSTLCSKSAIFSAAITFLTVVIPFLLAYKSHGFWLRSGSYREQPRVRYKHSYLLYLETDRADFPILCTNFMVSQQFDYCTTIKSREEDFNNDGKYDRLKMTFEAHVPSQLSVVSLQIVLIFDYVLEKYCLLQMESAGYLEFSSGLGLDNVEVSGDLKLNQKELLRSGIKHTRYNYSIFGSKQEVGKMLDVHQTLNNYGKRQVTTNIQNVFKSWTRGLILDEPFSISLDITYPEEIIYYSPSFWQIMKWAWQEYLALFLVFLFISRSIKNYIFSNRLIPVLKETPWSKYL